MLLYGQGPINLSYQPATFGGHRQCSSGDIIILVCRVIFKDNVTEGIYNQRVHNQRAM